MHPCVQECHGADDDPDVDELPQVDEGEWGALDEPGSMGEDRQDHAVVVQVADEVVANVDLGLFREYLNKVRLVEAPEDLQEDQEEGNKG